MHDHFLLSKKRSRQTIAAIFCVTSVLRMEISTQQSQCWSGEAVQKIVVINLSLKKVAVDKGYPQSRFTTSYGLPIGFSAHFGAQVVPARMSIDFQENLNGERFLPMTLEWNTYHAQDSSAGDPKTWKVFASVTTSGGILISRWEFGKSTEWRSYALTPRIAPPRMPQDGDWYLEALTQSHPLGRKDFPYLGFLNNHG